MHECEKCGMLMHVEQIIKHNCPAGFMSTKLEQSIIRTPQGYVTFRSSNASHTQTIKALEHALSNVKALRRG